MNVVRFHWNKSAELKNISAELSRQYPDTNKDISAAVMPINEFAVGPQIRLVFWSLMGAVGSGDGKPIGNAAPIFKDLSAELKVQTDKLAQIIGPGIAAFNAEAKRAGVDAIAAK